MSGASSKKARLEQAAEPLALNLIKNWYAKIFSIRFTHVWVSSLEAAVAV